MSQNYEWAANKDKLQRVLVIYPHGTEEQIKQQYIKIGGLVLDNIQTNTTIAEPKVDETNETITVPLKKRVRRKKNEVDN